MPPPRCDASAWEGGDTMRDQGKGSVDQLPSGRWRARMMLPSGARRSLGTFATRGEALAVADAATHLVAKHTGAVTPRAPTVAQWGTTWLVQREEEGVRSVRQERSCWRTWIEPQLGSMLVRDLTRREVVAWVAALREARAHRSVKGGAVGEHSDAARKVSRQVVVHALRVLRGALRAARDAGHVAHDATDGVKVARGREGRTEEAWTFLSAAEIEALTRCEAIPDPERAIYTVALYTGLRQGELWALRWEDVRLEGVAEITVRGSHQGPTKNRRVRRVPLLPGAVEALARLPGPRRGVVFPKGSGGQRRPDDDARWAPVMRANGPANGYRMRAGITRRVRFHDLRHTCASHLVMGTWGITLSLMETAQWLGHSSLSVTQRYAHLCPDRLAARVAAETGGSGKGGRGNGGGGGGQGAPDGGGASPETTETRDQTGPIGVVTSTPDADRARCKTPRKPGPPGATRTRDPRLRRPLLYPAELRAEQPWGAYNANAHQDWTGSGRLDSNQRHRAPKARALPGCATPRRET